MKKNILIAVDDSIQTKQSLQYAAKMFGGSNDVSFTLFHVQPIISQYLLDEARVIPKANAALKLLVKDNTIEAQGLLEKQKERMVKMGIPGEHIEMITQQRMMGLAKDILEHAHKDPYDAIIVGRRGLSRIQKTFMGSTSAKLLEHSDIVPVWMVDGEVTSQKVLVAVDGSESSYKAIDYLIFMLSENPKINYSLFHVPHDEQDMRAISFKKEYPKLKDIVTKGSHRLIEKFYTEAKGKFEQAEITANRVETITANLNTKVGKMILKEADKGDFGTVVVGRRGVNRAFFFGSVSRYVTERITDRALCLVS
jgi:nucleotide-binding universal stress UspA family protein